MIGLRDHYYSEIGITAHPIPIICDGILGRFANIAVRNPPKETARGI